MDQIPSTNYLSELRKSMDQYFSQEEIILLCLDLGIDYEHLPGQAKPMKIHNLILHLTRRDYLTNLIELCRQLRPKASWSDPPPVEQLLQFEELILPNKLAILNTILLPELALKLFDTKARKRVYQDEIVMTQQNTYRQQYSFGVALQNLTAGSNPAEKIDIYMEFCWRDRSNSISTAPQFGFTSDQPEGWSVRMPDLINDQAAILVFNGTEKQRCGYGVPLEWPTFQVLVGEKLDGHFLIPYRVNSASPHTSSQGELKIIMA